MHPLRHSAALLACVVLSVAHADRSEAQILYTNGPIATGTTNGAGGTAPGGGSWSEANVGSGTLGFGASAGLRQADDFTVPTGEIWSVASFDLFGYVTNSAATPSPFTSVTFRIWDGVPGAVGSSVIYGDAVSNVLASSVSTNIFRVANSSGATNRLIWDNTVNTPGLVLTAGTYWIDFSQNAGFVPPVTLPGQNGAPGANALLFTGAWSGIVDGTSGVAQAIPFQINAVAAVPEPSTWCAAAGALALLGWRRSRQPKA